MNPWIRRGAWTLAALAGLAGATLFVALQLADHKLARQVPVQLSGVGYRDDAATLARGRYLFASRGCADCHGADGTGRRFVDDGHGLVLAAPNISPGGRTVAAYRAEDWERTLRHCVKPSGRPMMVMPCEDYNRLTDDDIAALVAHVRHLPAGPGGEAVLQFPLPVRALYGLGFIPDGAAKVNHTLPPAQPVPEGVTREHGAYVANMCIGCHGPQLSGGRIPGAPPDWPAAADLRPGPDGVLSRYPDAASLQAMFRSGHRPDGSEIKVMPFPALRELNSTDVAALHLFLTTRSVAKQGA